MKDGGHPPSDIMYRVSGDTDGRLPSYVMIGLLHINRRKTVSTIQYSQYLELSWVQIMMNTLNV